MAGFLKVADVVSPRVDCRKKTVIAFSIDFQLRNAQERIMELETEKEHLQKRVEKFKQRRKEDI